jgi:putative transcriptional regulator
MDFPSLNGSMLVAAPSLVEANFCRTVLVLSAYSPQTGAAGFVINRPLDRTVADFVSSPMKSELMDVPVYGGGPVGTDRLSFASLRWSQREARLMLSAHLSVEEAAAEVQRGREVRAFVGYSGWGRGQLERELRQRAWIVSLPPKVLLAGESHEALWAKVLADMGPHFGLLARVPERPELN